MRFYSKETASPSYLSDGKGDLVDKFFRIISVSNNLANDSAWYISDAVPPKGKVKAWIVRLYSPQGSLIEDASHTWEVRAPDNAHNNYHLVLNIAQNGRQVDLGSKIYFYYTISF